MAYSPTLQQTAKYASGKQGYNREKTEPQILRNFFLDTTGIDKIHSYKQLLYTPKGLLEKDTYELNWCTSIFQGGKVENIATRKHSKDVHPTHNCTKNSSFQDTSRFLTLFLFTTFIRGICATLVKYNQYQDLSSPNFASPHKEG